MLEPSLAEAELLRVVSLLANMVCTAHKQQLEKDPTLDLPLDDKTVEPESM